MIGAHAFVEIDFVAEEFHLRLMNAHHSDARKQSQISANANEAQKNNSFGQHALRS